MPARTSAWLLAAGLVLGVAGCHRQTSGNPTARSAGTSNPTTAAQPGQGLQGGMGAGAAAVPSPRGTASSSAPTGKDLPSGNPGTTYRSPGKS
ncbi:MAG TPA: hypothetical protein VKD22_02600 [Ramlibacter sp.]|nr:hypothetical protein [Ramlibacter sp.]